MTQTAPQPSGLESDARVSAIDHPAGAVARLTLTPPVGSFPARTPGAQVANGRGATLAGAARTSAIPLAVTLVVATTGLSRFYWSSALAVLAIMVVEGEGSRIWDTISPGRRASVADLVSDER